MDITDDQADNSNVKSEFDVTSPDAHSWRSGTVYWVASLHTASGAVVDKGKLGEETEKVRVRGGGIITSHAQAMGAVGGQLYDEITIYDETVGHEGTGNGNLHDNAGMIPDDSYVIVRLWRNDGHNGQTKGQMVGQIRRDVNQENFIPFEDGGEAIDGRTNRRGYQTIKVTGEQFIVPECPSDGYENAGSTTRAALACTTSPPRSTARTVRCSTRRTSDSPATAPRPDTRPRSARRCRSSPPNGPRSGSASTRRTTPTRPSAATTC